MRRESDRRAAISTSVRPRAARPATSRSRVVRPSPTGCAGARCVAPSQCSASSWARVRSRAAAVVSPWPPPRRGGRGGQLGGVQEAAQLLQAAADVLQSGVVTLGQRLDGGYEHGQQPSLERGQVARQLVGGRRGAVAGRLVEGEDRVGDMAGGRPPGGRHRGPGPGRRRCRPWPPRRRPTGTRAPRRIGRRAAARWACPTAGSAPGCSGRDDRRWRGSGRRPPAR